MKFIAQLPESKHYRRVENGGKIKFIDKATPLLEIESPVIDPWSKEWIIMLGIKKGKNPSFTIAGKLSLKLFEQSPEKDLRVLKIERSFAFGKFDYPPRNSIYHIGFPLGAINQEAINQGDLPSFRWLQYDLFE